MAVTAMELAAKSSGPAVELQWVLDDIMAFRGSCEENIEEEINRNIIGGSDGCHRTVYRNDTGKGKRCGVGSM
jgi:hypothetical protein